LNNRSASSNAIPRTRLTQDGIMAKGSGLQASYGIPYNAEVIIASALLSSQYKLIINRCQFQNQYL
jgi:hypothetical protein